MVLSDQPFLQKVVQLLNKRREAVYRLCALTTDGRTLSVAQTASEMKLVIHAARCGIKNMCALSTFERNVAGSPGN